uniref:Uncharacterized protein n=1 Tax=Timema cristinae TaxID=61476 RepID=A0A7R9D6M2_TIMCR|nr:unnamed protein product [Timema cristinae]
MKSEHNTGDPPPHDGDEDKRERTFDRAARVCFDGPVECVVEPAADGVSTIGELDDNDSFGIN